MHRPPRSAFRHEAAFRGFTSRKWRSRNHQESRPLSAHQLWNEVRHRHAWIQSNTCKSDLEIGGLVGNGNIAGASEDWRNTNTISFNRRDDGNRNIQQCEPAVVETQHEIVACFGSHAWVGEPAQHFPMTSNREVLSSSPDDCRAQLFVFFELLHGGGECIAHFRAHRIAKLWIVQRDNGNGASIDECQSDFGVRGRFACDCFINGLMNSCHMFSQKYSILRNGLYRALS